MKIKSGFSLQYDEDGVCIIDEIGREVSPISATAAMAWEGFARGLSRESIIDAVVTEFSADRAQVSADLDALAEQLLALGYAEP